MIASVDGNTILIAVSTVLSALITVAGAIATAILMSKQNKQTKRIDEVHEQLKTSNGKSIASYVEDIAKNGTS